MSARPIDEQIRASRRIRHAWHALDEETLERAERGADLARGPEVREAERAAREVRRGRLLSDAHRDLLERLGDRADERDHRQRSG